MAAELRAILWLQWRLTLAVFRSRRDYIWARLGRIALGLFMTVGTLPLFAGIALALGVVLAGVSPQGAVELTLIVNTGTFFLWLLVPASYNSEIVERFELARLFTLPVSFRSLVIGGSLATLVSLTGLWTGLLLAGEMVGLAWHNPVALPLIVLGALPTFAVLVFTGRVMEDVADLVAGDRRLRGALVFLLGLPFFLLIGCNFYVNWITSHWDQVVAVLERYFGAAPSLAGLDVLGTFDALLRYLRLSRLLQWLPTGWGTAGMSLAVAGRWLESLGFLALSWVLAGGLLWAHGRLTRRLMQGTVVRLGAERVRGEGLDWWLRGPVELWGLVGKDWAYLRRSPVTKRVLLSAPILVASFGFALWQLQNVTQSGALLERLPFLALLLLIVSTNLAVTNFAGNYFGTVDREGFAALVLSPADRRWVFLAANLATLMLALVLDLVFALVVSLASGQWALLPLGMVLGFCLQVSSAPAYNLTSIVGAYRDPMQVWGRSQGNLWVFMAWLVASPPPVLLVGLPYLLWRPGVLIALPVAVVYSVGLYAVTLGPLARLMDRRVDRILAAVTE
ncbi:MAG: hypothetical protein ACYC5O_17765 [Anaerolineae bacterium]